MSSFTVHTESRGFIIGTVIASAAGLGLTITNSVYYSRARSNCASIDSNSANIMMWLNIILAVIFGIILIWAFYRLVVHPDLRKELGRKTSDYINAPPKGPVTKSTFIPSSNTGAKTTIVHESSGLAADA